MHYRLVVSGGLSREERQIKRATTWKPPRLNISKQQMEWEAMAAAFKFEKSIQAGYEIDKVKRFRDYAEYVPDLKECNGLAPTTIERYRAMLPRINDAIGHLKLTQIRPQHLNGFYKTLIENGVRNLGAIAVAKKVLKKKVDSLGQSKHVIAEEASIAHTALNTVPKGKAVKLETAQGIADALGYTVSELFTVTDRKKPLSSKTILEHHRLISMILARADTEMLIPYNPAAKASLPKVQKHEADYFQPEEIAEIVRALDSVPIKWKAMSYILIDAGCRRSELMGLQWNCVDLDKGVMMIRRALLYTKEKGTYVGSPKTGQPRAICLPSETIAVLKEYRTDQLRQKIRHADIWQDTGFLFTKDDGAPMPPAVSPTG